MSERRVTSSLAHVQRHTGLLVLLLVALLMRATDLSEWWLNPDEGIYYSTTTRAAFADFWSEVAANAHPPLYFLILRGMGLISWDFVWLRMFSVLCGLVAVLGAWAVARELGGRGSRGAVAGFVAGALVTASPGAAELSQVMRPYMLQLALLSGALFFLLRYLRVPAGRDLSAYIALVALALLTHYSTALALGAIGLIVLHDGVSRGMARREWRLLAVSHAVPALLLVGLYLVHLRPVMASALADEALDGWLSFYMIDAPADAWVGLLGFQSLMVHDWLRGPAAIFLIAAAILSLSVGKDRRPALLIGAGLLMAGAAAALGVYPFGSTRHTAWLLAFTVPALGWMVAFVSHLPRVRAARWGGLVAVVVAAGGPVGRAMGVELAPWSPTDRVLRESDLRDMLTLLDPAAAPRLVLMSAQSFYLLVPFYPTEREEAVFSSDGSLFYFTYGARTVLVSQAWDFAADEEATGSTHLAHVLTEANAAFPELHVAEVDRAALFVGGWRPAFVDWLVARSATGSFLVGQRSVPGLHAFLVDLPALRGALAVPGPVADGAAGDVDEAAPSH